MDKQKVLDRFYEAGTILRDLLLENPDNERIVDQVHQLVNHLLVIKGEIGEEN